MTVGFSNQIPFLQPQNTVERVLQKPLKDVLNHGANKKNSLLHFTLTDKASGKIVATNFQLLDKIKKSEQIVNPHLQVRMQISNKYHILIDESIDIKKITLNIMLTTHGCSLPNYFT